MIFAGNSEATSCVFLSPERTKKRKSYLPLSKSMLDGDFSVDFISKVVLESQQNVMGGEGDP